MNQVIAKLNHLHIAPRKVRLVADGIKGLSVNEAEAQLMFRPQRSSGPLLKLLRSAVANAKNNNKLSEAKLAVKKIKTSKKAKAAKIKTEEKEVEKLKRPKSSDISNKVSGEKVGFFKRIFRRKSV